MTSPTFVSSTEPLEIQSTTGSTLRGSLFRNASPRGVVVVSHGLGEHSACYDEIAQELSAIPGLVDVLTFDFRGHGHSSGKRGYVERYGEFLDDLRAVVRYARTSSPHLPLFVLGHSNGGLVALQSALDPEMLVDGLILSNPSIKVSASVPPHLYYIGLLLRKIAPGVTLTSTVADEHLTSDPARLAARKTDSLRHGRINAPLYFGMVESGAEVLARAPEIRLPLLMILGAADPVIDPHVSLEFYARLSSPDKTIRVFPQMLHEPLNEIGREAVVAEIVAWLKAHLDAFT